MKIEDNRNCIKYPADLISDLEKVGFKVWYWTSYKFQACWLYIPFCKYFWCPLPPFIVATAFFNEDSSIRWIHVTARHNKVVEILGKIDSLKDIRVELTDE